MRLVTLAYATADEFLASYHDSDGGTVSVQTRTDGTIGEQLLVEVSFPGLPNRALLRATVTSITFEHGLRFAVDEADATTRDFLLSIARGDNVVVGAQRDHARFPSVLRALISRTIRPMGRASNRKTTVSVTWRVPPRSATTRESKRSAV